MRSAESTAELDGSEKSSIGAAQVGESRGAPDNLLRVFPSTSIESRSDQAPPGSGTLATFSFPAVCANCGSALVLEADKSCEVDLVTTLAQLVVCGACADALRVAERKSAATWWTRFITLAAKMVGRGIQGGAAR